MEGHLVGSGALESSRASTYCVGITETKSDQKFEPAFIAALERVEANVADDWRKVPSWLRAPIGLLVRIIFWMLVAIGFVGTGLWLASFFSHPLATWLAANSSGGGATTDWGRYLRLALYAALPAIPLGIAARLFVRSGGVPDTNPEVTRLRTVLRGFVIAGFAYYSAGITVTVFKTSSINTVIPDLNSYLQLHLFDPLAPALFLSVSELSDATADFVTAYFISCSFAIAALAAWIANARDGTEILIVALVTAAVAGALLRRAGKQRDGASGGEAANASAKKIR